MTDILEITKHYFNIFSQKKISELSDLFSEDIKLRDWENQARGKTEVLEVNKKIFDMVKTINVLPLKLNRVGQKVYCELEITINNEEKILVLDVITFNDDFKISNIDAYKG